VRSYIDRHVRSYTGTSADTPNRSNARLIAVMAMAPSSTSHASVAASSRVQSSRDLNQGPPAF
jgi:hypothetical protein